MTREDATNIVILSALWERADLALGSIKYAVEMERRLSTVRPLALVTQPLGMNGEVRASTLNAFARSRAKRIFYYLMLASLVIKSTQIIRRSGVPAVASFGVGWVNDIAALLASLLTGRKLIMIFHHWPYSGHSLGQIFRAMRGEGRNLPASILAALDRAVALRALRRASLVVTPSEYSRRTLLSMVPAANAVVVQPGVDDAFFSGPAARPDARFDGIAVNRMAPEKGIYDLVEIWSMVVRRLPGAKLAVHGHPTGILGDWLGRVRSMGLERNIEYLGTTSVEELARDLRRSKVFLFPSHLEGFGIAVAEAMASGLPVVCYDIPPMNQVFRSEGTFFVREGDYAAFADAVIRLLQDPGLRESAGRANAEFARRFNWDASARRFESALLKTLSRP
ncbi:MAG: glycosyltransferase family 4 protein [Nitrososphaeria archaeon]